LAVLVLSAVVLGQAISYLPELSGDYRSTRLTGRDDLEMYIGLGHSLAHGRGYTRSFDPEHYIAHIHWPPGFSLLLAGTFLWTDSLWPAHLLVMSFAVANALLLFAITRRYVGEPLALFAVLMLVCSPLYDQLATHIMAEQPMTFFLLLALWSLGNWVRGGYRWDRWAVVAADAIGYGMLVKGLMLPVVAGFGLYALLCPRDEPPGRRVRLSRTCLLLAVALVPWVGWTVRSMTVKAPGYDGFTELQTFLRGEHLHNPVQPPSAFLTAAWKNIKWHIADRTLDAFGGTSWFLDEHLHAQLPAWSRMAVVGLLGLSFLLALRTFRHDGFITAALAMALLMLLPRPFGGAARYGLNLQPLFLLVVLGAFHQVWQALDRRYSLKGWNWLPRLGGIAMVGLALAALVTDHLRRQPQDDKVWNAYVTMCQEARDILPPDAVVVCHNETATRWITRRYSIPTERDLDGPGGRPVYVICPLPETLAVLDPAAATNPSGMPFAELVNTTLTKLGRRSNINRMEPPIDSFAGRLSEVARNDYYGLYRVRAEAH
jgi:hypothetical protein